MDTQTIPPLTPSAVEQLRTFIESAATVEPPMRAWELSLACGHTVHYRQHASLHAPDSPTWPCTECGHHQRMLGSILVNDLQEQAWRLREARLEHRRALEELARLKRQLARSELRVSAAQTSLVRAQHNVESFDRTPAPSGEIDVMDELPQQRPA